ncbi:probable disease resistance protein At1g58390 [Hevea brasiliensis]|uniref:probable disease resistance protein At1g58390 n=1 Tax=Hevea brasiliensis TaxID=3981 RepID=UPI0025D17A54|nr:probable disease resistance protein At1g58390 [Hevea brasiliensis]
MPYYLKPFFLYLSQFPEDWEIHKRRLILMWIAEGFVSQALIREGEETVEDVGEQYLEELVNSCIVQVSQRDHTGIGIKTFRIHDLMRDMCVLMAREENFLGISELYRQNIVTRRISVHPQYPQNTLDCILYPCYNAIHPFVLFSTSKSNVWKLEDWRHLLIDLPNVLEQCRMETLRNLENLRWAHRENLIRKNAMQNLTNLRNLAVIFKRSKEISAVMKSPIFSTGWLRSLNIRGKQSSFPNLEPLSYCESLTKLELHGIIPEDPQSLYHNLEYLPASLTKLILANSELKQDPMSFLEKLPALRFLYLEENSYKGTEMLCATQGFPQLEILKLESLGVEDWKTEEGAMPSLKILHLENLQELEDDPRRDKICDSPPRNESH